MPNTRSDYQRFSAARRRRPIVATVLAAYLLTALLVALSTFQVDLTTVESRRLVALGVFAPVGIGGVFIYLAGTRFNINAAIVATVGLALGQTMGFCSGASYLAPIIAGGLGAFVGTFVGIAAFPGRHDESSPRPP